MIEENILSINQQKKAFEWYEAHKSHVDRLVKITRGSYPPSLAEDKNNPHLWVFGRLNQ